MKKISFLVKYRQTKTKMCNHVESSNIHNLKDADSLTTKFSLSWQSTCIYTTKCTMSSKLPLTEEKGTTNYLYTKYYIETYEQIFTLLCCILPWSLFSIDFSDSPVGRPIQNYHTCINCSMCSMTPACLHETTIIITITMIR